METRTWLVWSWRTPSGEVLPNKLNLEQAAARELELGVKLTKVPGTEDTRKAPAP